MKKKLLLSIAIVLLFLPKINYGQTPNLGTSAGFVIFTSVGAVTNTGISQITGHVGSNVGASTNFGNVNGVMQSQNLATATCASDVLSAYNQLAATTATFFPSSSLGGDTLLPGVYSVTGASTLTNTLTLNAQGNPNALFIFKLQGAFSAAANAKVRLINGALACNVFWKIEGLTSLATGVTMRGTIIANNAAISMAAGDTLEGRAFSTAGAISINGTMAYTPLGCGSSFLTGPIAPPLGTTANYVLFSAIGPVTNTGATHATGDIGTNSGLTTGFNPLFVNGTIHPIPDGSTTQCATDLGIVYTYLNALPADIELLYPAQFGRNLVLTPHTYLLNAATTFTDTLFLNAQGNPNAIFVIKIYGALSTSTYSNVVLTNGTQSRNVYWLVSGAVSINDYSIFRGTIISNNGAISFATGATLDGRALTTVGALNVAAITANAPNEPFVVTAPANKLLCIGDTARFIVVASGTNLTYKWRRGNIDLVNGLTISGVNNDTLTIFPVTYADTASNYNVVIIGNVSPSDTTDNVWLRINAPIIITEPNSQTACAGAVVRFIVASTGTGLTYQWRKGTVNLINGIHIQGATSDTLTINGATISDTASNYNVIVSGICSPKDTSNNASFYLNNTEISVEPSSQNSCLGSAASFIVKATGTNLTYQWQKGNVNLINSGNISGVTDDTLTFNATTFADTAFNYRVIVSGTCNPKDTSVNVSLRINNQTVITTEPTNQASCIGSPVRFVVKANGVGLTYQWQKGNINLINSGNISGVTDDTLTFNATTFADTASNYRVIVSGTCNPKDTSVNVSLLINNQTVIVTEPTNQASCLGNPIRFVVAASGAGLTYQWQKGNINLINSGNISGVTDDTLTFNVPTFADTASNYRVIVSGTCNPKDTSVNVSLLINNQTVIITEPTNQITCTGNSVSFIVAASGAGLTYQWQKGNINLINSGNISGVTDDTLTFNVPTFADTASNYRVIVSGTCNPKDTSANVALFINNQTVITTEPSNQITCTGNSVSFIVAASGAGLTYQWRKGNVNLTNTGNITGANTSTLTLNPVNIADTANDYDVIVTDLCNFKDTSVNVSLTVNSPAAIISVQPASQTICEGNLASFSVVATGSGLNYQWRKGNSNLINGGNISGVFTAVLTINPAGAIDSADNYRVLVTSATCPSTVTSVNVSLNISTSAVITTEPTNQATCVGNLISFNVTASGSGIITYQWRKGNVNLINSGNTSGVTTNNLVINPIGVADAANNYNVIITGGCLSADTSVDVSLTANEIPVAVASGTSPVCIGKPINLTAQPLPNATYSWSGPNGYSSSSQNPTVSAATFADSGFYYLIVTQNTCNSPTVAVNISVIECPNISLNIPEGFSPNGDGVNDWYVIRGLENYSNNSIKVFNRWGSLVFESSPYNNDWGGKSTSSINAGGADLPIGVYFLVLDLGDGSTVKKGTIYLNK